MSKSLDSRAFDHDLPEDDLHIITDAMEAAVTRCSRGLDYLWVSAPYARWLGLTPDQIIGRPIVEIIGPRALEQIRPYFERALRGDRVYYEDKILFRGIGERWIRATYTPTFGTDRSPDGWVAVVTDIDAKRRTEEALREQNKLLLKLHEASTVFIEEDNLEAALRTTLDAVIAATHADFGNIQQIDEQTETLRIVAQRGFGSEFLDFFSEVSENQAACGAAKQSRSRVIVENVSTHPIFAESSINEVMARAGVAAVQSTPLFGRSGAFLGVISTHFRGPHRPNEQELRIVDMFARQASDLVEHDRLRRELKRTVEALRSASRAKDEFLAILSHELRNPLASIVTSVPLLEAAAPGSDAAKLAIGIVSRQSRLLARMVDDLLDLTGIDHGKIELRRRKLDLNDLVRAVVRDHDASFESKSIRREVSLPAAPVFVEADDERITQVVGNLLQNAAKFTSRGGLVEVTVEAVDGSALLRVRDDGVGIAPEMLPRLFDPFVQGDRGLARERGGLGLGLVLAKRFTELHGGNITISSKGTGQGAEVVVRFPMTAGPIISPKSAGTVSAGPLRILIIEDNSDTAESLKELLVLRGHVVEVATEGLLGVELASRTSPEVVLCDIGLPDIDGYKAAREIRARARSAYLVALSGYAQSDDVMKARQAGFDAHLAKPASVEQLEKLLAGISNAAK